MGRPRGTTSRVAPLVQEVLANTLLTRSRDPILRQAVITDVQVNADRSVAKIYYVGLVEGVSREELAAAFERSRGFLRRAVSERLPRLRRSPELRFYFDEGVTHGRHMEGLLRELVPPEPEEDGEPRP